MWFFDGSTRQCDGKNIPLTCPHCGKEIIPVRIGSDWIIERINDTTAGIRRCAHSSCNRLIFIVYNHGYSHLLATFPSVRVGFNAESIPERIIDTFGEVIDCHATGAYKAAALMIRRTLEEICLDKNAKGKWLHDRLKALEEIIILPRPLLAAMQELKLLGNDAAHVEARAYDAISKEEVEVGIELVKEILKGVYQLDDLLGKLTALKTA